MSNQIDASGLQIQTLAEIKTALEDDMKAIYGSDINLDSDSPDGQMLAIIAQAAIDKLELLQSIYTGFDPDQAVGTTLDERVAINGIQRQAGTNTIQSVTITVTDACSLVGLDDSPDDPYTVKDNAGTEWQLVSSHDFSGAGFASLVFQSKETGAILSTPNTITEPVTVVLGVSSINNPLPYTTLGIDEETDADLRLRRRRSVGIGARGFKTSLQAALESIDGVISASVFENVTDAEDSSGVPAHSIWIVISGTADAETVANAIYAHRTAGCGMKTNTSDSFTITQADGSSFPIYWDVVAEEDAWIEFTVSSLDGVVDPLTADIQAGIAALYVPGTNETVNINKLATYIQQIDPNCLVTAAGFSLTELGSYTSTLAPSAANKKLVFDSSRINITEA